MFEEIKNKISDLVEKESRKIYEVSFSFPAAVPLEFQELFDMIQSVPSRDDIRIYLFTENDERFTFNKSTAEAEYNSFIGELLEDEQIFVKLEINT